jgi:uncharacterized membrane protein YeaQ/YmgE (transglycosylase-associated protein family)
MHMTLEDIVRSGPFLILAGMTVGWIADAVRRAGGHGFIPDAILGIAGSVVVGATVQSLIGGELGLAATFVTGGVGAALVIGAQRGLRPSGRLGT